VLNYGHEDALLVINQGRSMDARRVKLAAVTEDGGPFAVFCDQSKGVLTTHDDDGWMTREFIRKQGSVPFRGFAPMRSTERFARRPPRCSHARRGTTRGFRSRPRRTARTVGSRGDPPQPGDDEPPPPDLASPAGFAAASRRLHEHLRRPTAARRVAMA
jgi:hypothetical protein